MVLEVRAEYTAVSLEPDMAQRPVPYNVGMYPGPASVGHAAGRATDVGGGGRRHSVRARCAAVVNTLYMGAPTMVWELAGVLAVVAVVSVGWAGPALHRWLAGIMASDKRRA